MAVVILHIVTSYTII